MKWGTVKGQDMQVAVWTRKVAAGMSINLTMQEPFVGGLAVKADSGEWRLYEEQEQLTRALSASVLEHGANDEELNQAAILAKQAEQRLEEAQLEQAIALSLQAEEERLRQFEQFGSVATPAPQEPAAPVAMPVTIPPAPCEIAESGAAAYNDAAAPSAPAPLPMPSPSPEAVEASRYEEPIPDLPPQIQELNPVMPRMMRLQPLASPPPLTAPVPPIPPSSADQLRADAMLRRERAERAIEAPSMATPTPQVFSSANHAPEYNAAPQVPAAYHAPAAYSATDSGPTDEERLRRAEHLKRQRALLMEKRKTEREQQLQAFHAANGTNRASIDRFVAASTSMNQAGIPGAALPPQLVQPNGSDHAEAAQHMRRALTLQLRQTLTSQVPVDSLGESVQQLEQRKSV